MAARKNNPMRTGGRAWGPERVRLGLSLRELSKRSGVSRGMLSLMELGRLTPTAKEWDDVSAVLEVERLARIARAITGESAT